ncbi:MAG: class I SAM-dependent methyltransferase [Leptospiraceae bacterium]|nr:class I SAM-dependent methyltransferase [Leptospiraceae bacterium]
MQIYSKLASKWYPLLDPLEDHEDEANIYMDLLQSKGSSRKTLLELGAGAGNNAYYMKKKFQCTLTDLSLDMLALSKDKNPECEHHAGDMRNLRLGNSFDIVFAHDALVYITSEEDLRAVAETAFVHTKVGGLALFVPDSIKDTFEEKTELHSGQDENRAMRCIGWSWDPDPTDTVCYTEYSFLFREGETIFAHHDRHLEGLFSKATWIHVLESVGFKTETITLDLDGIGEVFLCSR